jgi:hypothetical protein
MCSQHELNEDPVVNRPCLVAIINDKSTSMETNVDLLGLAIDLLAQFSESCKALEGFVELYEPVLQLLRDVDSDALVPELQVRLRVASIFISAPNPIQGSNISDHGCYPETRKVRAPSSPGSAPPGTQTYPDSIIHSEV